MDQELKDLLAENLRVSRETNQMLRSLRNQARWGLVGKIILWVALVVIPLYFILPFINTYMDVLEGSAQSNPDLQKLIDQYRELQ